MKYVDALAKHIYYIGEVKVNGYIHKIYAQHRNSHDYKRRSVVFVNTFDGLDSRRGNTNHKYYRKLGVLDAVKEIIDIPDDVKFNWYHFAYTPKHGFLMKQNGKVYSHDYSRILVKVCE